MSYARKDILNGWKEIAQYVARDIRTVERWEKQRGLPVRRVPGSGRATVFARISELEEWLSSSNLAEAETLAIRTTEPVFEIAEPPTPPAPAPAPVVAAAASAVDAEALSALPMPSPDIAPGLENPTLGLHNRRASNSASPIPSTRSRFFVPTLSIAAACILTFIFVAALAGRVAARTQIPPHAPVISQEVNGPVRHSSVPGVDDLYLRGCFYYEQRTPDTLSRALQHFTQAIEKDPGYAPAYVGLANTYALLREYSVLPDNIAFPKALAADKKALQLDPDLPQAHASLGFIDFFWLVDAPAAEKEFQTALALDPFLVLAHHWYGSVLIHEGRYNEAVHELDIARNLQPSSSAIFVMRALAFGLSGHRDEARAMLEEHLSQDHTGTDHNSSTAHIVLGTLNMMQPRDVPAFLKEWRISADLRHDTESLKVEALAEAAYRTGGEAAMGRTILAVEQKSHSGPTHGTIRMADSEALLGQPDKAFADLGEVIHRHDRTIISVFIDPMLLPLQKDPRFGSLRAQLHLPPAN